MGYSPAESAQIVYDYVKSDGVFPPYEQLWDWRLGTYSTKPRVLLTVLSVPFVWLFGPGGIVVIPSLAFVAAVYLIYRFARIHTSVPASVLATILPLLSPLAVWWSVGGLTDSLALLLHVAMLVLLPWRKAATWKTVAGIAAVTALTGAARFIAPFTVAAVAGLWLWAMRTQHGRRGSWTAAAAGAAGGLLLGMLWTSFASSPLTARNQLGAVLGSRLKPGQSLISWYLNDFPAVLRQEWDHLTTSAPLMVLFAAAAIACVVGRRTVVPWLVLPAVAGAIGVMVVNPADTVFRYELPVLPAFVAAAAFLVDRLSPLFSRSAGPAFDPASEPAFDPAFDSAAGPAVGQTAGVPGQRAAGEPDDSDSDQELAGAGKTPVADAGGR
jgi:4-amino-4-deoxy-L-arabinose transferase-like glycosyltransferase